MPAGEREHIEAISAAQIDREVAANFPSAAHAPSLSRQQLSTALRAHGHDEFLVHTGQHHVCRSASFFHELGIPEPTEG